MAHNQGIKPCPGALEALWPSWPVVHGAHPETRTLNLSVLSGTPLPIGLDGHGARDQIRTDKKPGCKRPV